MERGGVAGFIRNFHRSGLRCCRTHWLAPKLCFQLRTGRTWCEPFRPFGIDRCTYATSAAGFGSVLGLSYKKPLV